MKGVSGGGGFWRPHGRRASGGPALGARGADDSQRPRGLTNPGAPRILSGMLYFAFASNLDPAQMAVRSPGHTVVGLAALREHKLAFPAFSQHWGGGTAGVAVAHGDTVWGVLYDLTDEDLRGQDEAEGFRGPGDQHNVYDREQVWVDLVRPDDGSFPRRVRAWIYVARPWNGQLPTRRYLDTILRGARHHRLPDDYVARLGRLPAAPEPEPQPEPEGT
jgi:hypothetical protein